MGKIAFLFPGQGSQFVGMGQDLYEKYDDCKELFAKGNEALAFDLQNIMFSGPIEELTKTNHAQPALVMASIAAYQKLVEHGINADYMAGHSLGEYTALIASGVVSFEDGIRMVQTRGQLMSEAVPNGKGTMLAVLGLTYETIQQIVEEARSLDHIVNIANINTNSQIVLSGTVEGIEAITEVLANNGAKKLIPLKVSGPFHSELMVEAAEKLKLETADIHLSQASTPIVSNVTAESCVNGDELFENAITGMYSPVRWVECIQFLLEQGVDTFIEVGPGKVLTGLVKSIHRRAVVHSVNDDATLKQVVQALKGE